MFAAMLCVLVVVEAEPGQQAPDTYAIGPSDVLSITCFNDQTISGKFTVQPDGFIGLQLIGSVKVSGLTAREVENLLKSKYKAGLFIDDPRISVTVEQFKSQKVILQGEVRTQSEYPLTGGLTLLQLIAQAGGLLGTASGEVLIARLTSDGKTDIISADLSQLQNGVSQAAIPLRNGDVIIVPSADKTFIVGEVKTPGAYPVGRNTTMLQLLSLAGGQTADAAMNRITIIRIVNGKRTEINKVKLTEIVKPGDTIVVPTRHF